MSEKEVRKVGRTGIDEAIYTNCINQWLAEGIGIDDINPTMLRAKVGGAYPKAQAILDNFKAGYQSNEQSLIPDMPADMQAALLKFGNEFWGKLYLDMKKESQEKDTMLENLKKQFSMDRNGQAEYIESLLNNEESLERQLKESKAAFDQIKKSWDEQAETIIKKEAEIEFKDKTIGQLNNKVIDQSSKIEDLVTKNTDLTNAWTSVEKTLIKANGINEALSSKIGDLKKQCEKLDETKAKLTESIEQGISERGEISSLQIQVRSLKEERDHCRERVSDLEAAMLTMATKVVPKKKTTKTAEKKTGTDV